MLLACVLAAQGALTPTVQGGEPSQRFEFRIERATLGEAVDKLASQAGVQLLYPYELAQMTGINPVIGQYTLREALEIMFRGRSFSAGLTEDGVLTISLAQNRQTKAAEDMTNKGFVKSLFRGVSALVLGTGVATGAHAQDGASTASGVEEVIITARKREESAMKVPVVATAFSSKQLEQFATNNVYSVAERVPSFIPGTNAPGFGVQISLRGIGVTALTPTMDQSVSFVIDGLSLAQGQAFEASMFDMAGLEVLRGPQALFFGKNATAGLFSIRTANPTDEFEIIARGAYEFEAQEKVGELIVSGPVTDALKLRLATRFSDIDGYFENQAVGGGFGGVTPKFKKYPGQRNLIVRGTALWEPSDKFDATVKANYTRSESDVADSFQLVSCPDGISGPSGFQFLSPTEDCKADKVFNIVDLDPAAYPGIRGEGSPFADIYQVFGTVELNYHLTPHLTATSVSGAYAIENTTMQNGLTSGFVGSGLSSDIDFYRRDLTQEVRLTSDFDFPVNFMVGSYYQNAYLSRKQRLIGNRTAAFSSTLDLPVINEFDIETISGFGQISVKPFEIVEFTAGARWTDEDRNHASPVRLSAAGPVQIPLGVTRLSSSSLSPELTLTITPTDDLTLFGSYREALKSGSFSATGIVSQGDDTSFGDEKVQGWEGGVKARLFDRSLAVNVSGYTYKYSDLQVGAFDQVRFVNRVLNAASADVYGVDIDATYKPPQIDGLSLFVAGNWNHARYNKFDNAPCWDGQTFAQGCNQLRNPGTGLFTSQDLSGRELVRAPDFTASFGFNYERPVANGRLILAVGSTTQWSDEYYTDLRLRDDMIQDAFFKTSLSMSIRDAEGGWELAVIGRNLNDEATAGNCSISNGQNDLKGGIITGSPTNAVGSAGVGELRCRLDRPREVWVQLTLRPMELYNRLR